MGEAEDLKQNLFGLKVEIEETKRSCRELLMPHLDPESLDMERYAVLSAKLIADTAEYQTLLDKLNALKKEYGLK